jgi:cytochrome c oxidase subunit 4
MSAPTATTAPALAAGHHEPSKFHFYIQIAMILAVITGIEVVLIYLPIAKWLVVTTLIVLSTVKFMFVIFYFMHLRWDKVFCTILFFIGLVLASFTMYALMELFASDAGKPLTAAALTFARSTLG